MDALVIAATGMRSAERRIAVSAHNVANIRTEDFRPFEAHQRSLPDRSGSEVIVRQEDLPRDVDLVDETVEQILSSIQFQASFGAFQIALDTRGRLFDLFA